mmetsp:Transcript_52041/g.165957  ORF Transcript_52041/g.165957 Transcript_52041/m.165957 type:complete len:233 (-) Transcript_52041:366-1064(-)
MHHLNEERLPEPRSRGGGRSRRGALVRDGREGGGGVEDELESREVRGRCALNLLQRPRQHLHDLRGVGEPPSQRAHAASNGLPQCLPIGCIITARAYIPAVSHGGARGLGGQHGWQLPESEHEGCIDVGAFLPPPNVIRQLYHATKLPEGEGAGTPQRGRRARVPQQRGVEDITLLRLLQGVEHGLDAKSRHAALPAQSALHTWGHHPPVLSVVQAQDQLLQRSLGRGPFLT